MAEIIEGIDPVFIVLDEIEVDEGVRLSGIDLDTGQRASIHVVKDQPRQDQPATSYSRPKFGLIAKIEVVRLAALD